MSEDKIAEPAAPAMVQSDPKQALIKLVLELGPLVLFFIMNSRAGIFTATAWFMAAMVVSLAISWVIFKRVAVMPLVTGIAVLFFGSLTLILHDETFIKMKPTIVNVLFGTVLLGGLPFGHSLLRYVFGEVYKLTEKGWFILSFRWGVFFFVLAALNEIVWRFGGDFLTFMDQAFWKQGVVYPNDSEAANSLWAAFKLFGIMPITLIFSMFQLPVLTKYADHGTEETVKDVVD